MNNWEVLSTDEAITKTIDSLGKNGITAQIVSTGEEAKKKILELIPLGAEVMTMSSVTLSEIGITAEINESEKYNSVKKRLTVMDRQTQGIEMQKLGAAPEYAIGSVNAVTEDGRILISSNTGSQIPAYAYASAHVIWVVGIQKIVKDIEEGEKRIYNYVLPLESERMGKVLNKPDYKSNVSKLLIINREIKPNRLHVIFVKEKLGY